MKGPDVEPRTPQEVLKMVKDEGCDFVDLRFSDLPGIMQHVTIPAHVLSEDHFTVGHGFDGSSVRGFQEIQESDMVLITDPNTAYIDPFMKHKTAVIHCFVADPVTGESYSRDPRYVAKKAEDYLKSSGIADTAYFPYGERSAAEVEARSHALTSRLVGEGCDLVVVACRSTRSRVSGTPDRRSSSASRCPTSPTSPAPSRATSPSRPWTTTRTCAAT